MNEGSMQLPGLQAEFAPFDFTGLNMLTESTLFDYRATVDALHSTKGGIHSVQLGGTNGTNVPDILFSTLASNPAASIEFLQEGANITFRGSDVNNAAEGVMYDFGFIPLAEHENQMRSALSDGQSAFTYSFLGHGELPGVATFAITTDIAEGTNVNVYYFDEATGGFSLIAGNIAVGAGGVVTYKNNTMSEYLITTDTVKGARVSDMAGQQKLTANYPWLPVVIIGIAAVGFAVVVWVFTHRRKRARKVQ